MDDLKTFGRDEEQLRQAMHIIKTFSEFGQMRNAYESTATASN